MVHDILRAVLGHPVRVLIIDDNVDAADSLALLLDLLGFPVRVAYDGAGGLAAAAEWAPGCVLLDIRMPGLDGYEVAYWLRALPGLGGVQVVALSSYSDAAHRTQLADAGFDHAFVKPADPHEVVAFLRSLF